MSAPYIADMEAEAAESALRIVLPWPDAKLSPNARVHWRTKAPVKKRAREYASYATYAAANIGLRELRQRLAGSAPIPVKITFYPPSNHRRDRDNMQASLKHHLDGIADALGVDDNRFRPTYDFELPEAPGRVEVTL